MNGISGKTVIVTGGAAMLGAGIARAFHAVNANVAIADIDSQRGSKIIAELGEHAMFQETDITSDEHLDALVKVTLSRFGGIDFLVNNAVTYLDHGLASSRKDWLQALNTNVVSGAMLVSKVIPHMRVRGGGVIINLASVAGKFGVAERALYPTSKAAILQLTRNQAATLAADRIRVNSVSPAWTWSDSLEKMSGDNVAHADSVAAALHPLGRTGRPNDVANAILFLCSNDARFITGHDLAVDGGYSMLGPEQGRAAKVWFDRG